MINFGAVDFSERRHEEVISFFWRSVYIYANHYTDAFVDFVSKVDNIQKSCY